jgi:hypothetical protein
MQAGSVDMKMRFLSLNFGLTSKDLYFTPTEGKTLLLRSSAKTNAYRCSTCGSVLIMAGKAK